MPSRFAPRWIYAGIAAACFGLIASALYLQHARNLEPCPLCILQRIAFLAVGAVALIGVLSATVSRSRSLPVILGFPILGGLVTAARHVWLERFPPQGLGCGVSDLGYLMQTTPLAKLLPVIFRGTGDCSVVLWRFLGLSMAEWSLLCFAALLGVIVVLLVRAASRHRLGSAAAAASSGRT